MFGSLGGPEILLIFIVALIVFGPKRLPEIGRTVGGWVREFRKATGEFRSNIEREIGFDPLEGVESTRKVRRDLLSAVSAPIRDITEETWRAAQGVRQEAEDAVQDVRTEASRTLGAMRAVDPEVIPPTSGGTRASTTIPRQREMLGKVGWEKGEEEKPESPGRVPPAPETPVKAPPRPEYPGVPSPEPGPPSPPLDEPESPGQVTPESDAPGGSSAPSGRPGETPTGSGREPGR